MVRLVSKEKVDKNYYRRVLISVLGFLKDSGLSSQEIGAAVEEIFKAEVSKNRSASSRAKPPKNIDTICGAVLHRWHREVALLGKDAKPKPLKLLGAHPSVESLIDSENPDISARELALSMRQLGLISRRGQSRYVPKSRIATVSVLHPVLVEHVAKSLTRYLDTVRQNISPDRNVPTLIERYTHVSDLDGLYADDFRNFAQSHGSALLASADDWLEGRRVGQSKKKKASRGVAAGVHVFAYIEPPTKRSATKRRATRA